MDDMEILYLYYVNIFSPRFLTKSRLAFTIFNSLLLGLLLIHFAASIFYEKTEHQPPNMVFPALFATGWLSIKSRSKLIIKIPNDNIDTFHVIHSLEHRTGGHII